MHWDDIQRLLNLLLQLRDAGNTVIVIEHNLDVIRFADWIVELGPGGGADGGRVVYEGNLAGIAKCSDSQTGQFVG